MSAATQSSFQELIKWRWLTTAGVWALWGEKGKLVAVWPVALSVDKYSNRQEVNRKGKNCIKLIVSDKVANRFGPCCHCKLSFK